MFKISYFKSSISIHPLLIHRTLSPRPNNSRSATSNWSHISHIADSPELRLVEVVEAATRNKSRELLQADKLLSCQQIMLKVVIWRSSLLLFRVAASTTS